MNIKTAILAVFFFLFTGFFQGAILATINNEGGVTMNKPFEKATKTGLGTFLTVFATGMLAIVVKKVIKK
jgi:hypothetical protein